MRQEILNQHAQVNIVSNGIMPIQLQNIQTEVRLPMVRYAEELGAKIHADVTKSATQDGSDKMKRARESGCCIVYPSSSHGPEKFEDGESDDISANEINEIL